MKKYIYTLIFLVSLLGIVSCAKKQEISDDDRPDKRIYEKMLEYSDILTSSEGGWIGYLYPAFGGGFTFKFNFSGDQSVLMTALLNENSLNIPKTSLYSLRAPQVPSLYFDTYSYIHELADPAITKYGGQRLLGAGGDFEFSFISVSPDTIRLKGNFRGSDLILVKADPVTSDSYLRGVFNFKNNVLEKINQLKSYHKKLTYDGVNYQVIINTDHSTITFYYNRGGVITRFTSEYASSNDGILLRTPFEDGNLIVRSLSDFDFDISNNHLSCNLNFSGQLIDITSVDSPVFIYKDGAPQFFGRYTKQFSTNGFNFNGIKDIHQLASNSSFISNSFRQRYYINNLDRMENYYYSNGLEQMFYYNLRGNINTPNVIKFEVYGNYGTIPTGTPLLTAVENFKTYLRDIDGFYVYVTGEDKYDFVSAGDGRKWARFY